MRIKHFQGYGFVNAKKLSCKPSKVQTDWMGEKDCTMLSIRVSGLHEWGLVRDDRYDVCNWLVKKFIPEADYRNILNMTIKVQDEGDWRTNRPEVVDYHIALRA